MSRLGEAALKRKRPGSDAPNNADLAVLNVIRSKGNMAIAERDIKFDIKLPDSVVKKSLKSLISSNSIKVVQNIQRKGIKHYIAADIEPSKEITGGDFYVNGELDKDFIDILKKICLKLVTVKKVATVETVYESLSKEGAVKDCTKQLVTRILHSLVLENELLEVKSTGLGEYHSIPLGAQCYRIANVAGVNKGHKIGAMASIPCGMCPRIRQCTPDGIISPKTCVYYTKWLDIEF
ncbi:hypothetical protein M9H77_25296 [Catharanthus roseus]|uniref:Uncharacterized protein n=1 Tax=Catharanthus roseus TaxID=4058 RepID=A0ACC0A6H7_CATRO|nr:hypothetical protein M9H77_25296 [Catharanthus roseus]